MKRQLKILLAGLFVIVPFAITVWVIWSVGLWLEVQGQALLRPILAAMKIQRPSIDQLHGVGAVILLLAIYVVGLLTRSWLFGRLLGVAESIIEHMPGVKTIYESVRDLMKLFGSDSSRRMGQVVEYQPPGTEVGVLGILTNEQPAGASGGKVAVYFPLAYMIGGPVLFVQEKYLRKVDLPVESALRMCATAQVGIDRSLPPELASAIPPAVPKGKAS